MPRYVNTGNTSAPRNSADAPESRINCALCTAAALVPACPTSGDVNLALQATMLSTQRWGPMEIDLAFTMWWRAQHGYVAPHGLTTEKARLHDQIEGMRNWLQLRGLTVHQHGAVSGLIALDQALLWMAGRPDGAKFAVYIQSFDLGGAHWLYAQNNAGTVGFIDYQMQTVAHQDAPPQTTAPTCGDETADEGKCVILGIY